MDKNKFKLISNQTATEGEGRIPSYKPLELLASNDGVELDTTITLAGIRSIADQPIRIHTHRITPVDDPRPRYISPKTTSVSPTYGFLLAVCNASNTKIFNALNSALPWIDLEVYTYQDEHTKESSHIAIVPLAESLDQEEWVIAQQLLSETLTGADIEVVESANEVMIPTSHFLTNNYERNRNNRMGFRLKLVSARQKK